MEGKSIEPQEPIMRICRYAETGTLSCGRAERPTELASQVHPPLGMVLLGEQAVRGIGIVRQPVQQKRYLGPECSRDVASQDTLVLKIIESPTEFGIVRVLSRNWRRDKKNRSAELASR